MSQQSLKSQSQSRNNRGRPRIFDEPLSTIERNKRYRTKQKKHGTIEISLRLQSKEAIELFNELQKEWKLSRAALARKLIEDTLVGKK